MDTELRKILSKLVLGIRHLLEGYNDDRGVWHAGDLEQSLNQIGVWRDRPAKPLEELPQLSEADNKTRKTVDAYIKYREETGVNRAEAVEEFIRESAYTWFNRLFALRCMEARGIIDEVIHQKDIYGGRSLQHNRLAIRQPELCAGEDDGLYAILFQEFDRRAHELPILFNAQSPAVALRPSVSVVKRLIAILSGREPVNGNYASDETFMAPDAFGWAYQYWNAEEKDRVFERVRTEKAKIEGRDIIPVTCIYTEPYMVKFLVQNSLGAQWCCMHPESQLYRNWEYYVRDADRSQVDLKPVREITFLDPACGSGHFLLEAFDLYYHMYSEEGILSERKEICASILENNLYGIDIDERAIQISIAVLWMKAKESAPGLKTSGLSGFHDHLVATNIRLPRGRDHLKEFLRKHPEDLPLESALESIFEAMKNVHEIGSLLKIEEPLQQTFEQLRTKAGIQTTLWRNGFTSVDVWRENVIYHLMMHFNEEAVSSDYSQAFFGHSVNKGLRLVDILSTKYDIVSTNPPYMGSRNIGSNVMNYLNKYYESGKQDLYAAFIICCSEKVNKNGKIGMVTQHSWMFLKTFLNMRAYPINKASDHKYKGLLRESKLETIAHLGSSAFEEIGGEVVSIVLFTFSNSEGNKDNYIVCYRLVGIKDAKLKNIKLLNNITHNKYYQVMQKWFLSLEGSPLSYWISEELISFMMNSKKLSSIAHVGCGVGTRNENRLLKKYWEIDIQDNRWKPYAKGGQYQKWVGLLENYVDWQQNGIRVKENIIKKYPYLKGNYGFLIRDEDHHFKKGLTYTDFAQGCFSCRLLDNALFSDAGPGIFFDKNYRISMMAWLNSHIVSYLLRSISPSFNHFSIGYVSEMPIPSNNLLNRITNIASKIIEYKKDIVSYNLLEPTFKMDKLFSYNVTDYLLTAALLHTLEGILESIFYDYIMLNNLDKKSIEYETGRPCGLYPMLIGYDSIPEIQSIKKTLSESNINIYDVINIEKYDDNKILKIKKYMLNIVKNGFNNNLSNYLINENSETEDKISQGAHNPFPSETIIENLSHKLQVHPLSVYWLLEEVIDQDKTDHYMETGRKCIDIFSVLILRLLGHSWPQQIEAGEPIPDWVDPDGIIPITGGIDEPTLLDCIREYLNVNFKQDSINAEQEFEELIGKPLGEWLLYDFFKHHVKQFKKRPIVWQIQSMPQRGTRQGRGRKVELAFSCLVYCKKVDEDTFHKIRSQYVRPLKNGYKAELRTLETIGLLNTEQTVRRTRLEMLIDELEEFDAKLEKVITGGFDSKELKDLIKDEALDQWCSIDGEAPLHASREGFYLQERGYIPDFNDGVRMNIAPLQKAGLLSSDVLAKKDVDRAISDRAAWRADERRWCREDKLSEPGWWKKRVNITRI